MSSTVVFGCAPDITIGAVSDSPPSSVTPRTRPSRTSIEATAAPVRITAPFARALPASHGVAAIPVSAFYAAGAVRHVVLFCFAKRDATLDAALERLAGVVRRAA